MHILPIFNLGFCFLIFLITLYSLVVEDFSLFKKRITTDRIFDIAIIASLIALFLSRLVYVIFNFSFDYLNPLVFLLFPYFPGLSFAGAIIGSVGFIFFYTRKNKLLTEQFLDFFGLSLLASYSAELFINLLIIQKSILSSIFIFGIVLNIILFFINHKIYKKASWKEGSIGILSLLYTVLLSFAAGFVNKTEKIFFFLNKEDFLLLLILIIGFFILARKEKFIARILAIWIQK